MKLLIPEVTIHSYQAIQYSAETPEFNTTTVRTPITYGKLWADEADYKCQGNEEYPITLLGKIANDQL